MFAVYLPSNERRCASPFIVVAITFLVSARLRLLSGAADKGQHGQVNVFEKRISATNCNRETAKVRKLPLSKCFIKLFALRVHSYEYIICTQSISNSLIIYCSSSYFKNTVYLVVSVAFPCKRFLVRLSASLRTRSVSCIWF